MQNFRNLKVLWKAHALARQVFAATGEFPRSQAFVLAPQMQRASTSVGSNIAEGCSRRHQRDFRRFLEVALGSANELDYQLMLARDVGLLSIDAHDELHRSAAEVQSMLAGLISRIDSRESFRQAAHGRLQSQRPSRLEPPSAKPQTTRQAALTNH
jgi:four helix bundle protein